MTKLNRPGPTSYLFLCGMPAICLFVYPAVESAFSQQPKANIFVDPLFSGDSKVASSPSDFQERYAKAEKGWIDLDAVYEKHESISVAYLELGDGNLALGYLVTKGGKLHFYQWKGIKISNEAAPKSSPHRNNRLGIGDPEVEIVDVKPAVQFLVEGPGATATPGFLDFQNSYFYAFENVVLPVTAAPPRSAQHRSPLLPFRSGERQITKRSIPIPDYLKKTLAPWTIAPAAASQPDTPSTAPAPPPAAAKKSSK